MESYLIPYDATLSQKKDRVVEMVEQYGLGLGKAYTLAYISPEERESIDRDQFFMARVNYAYAKHELGLLGLHTKGMMRAAERGSVGAVQWKLAHMNPERWGQKQLEEGPQMPTIVFEEVDNGLL
jgi:hypothetical protein